jgi:DNA topoisomerase-1
MLKTLVIVESPAKCGKIEGFLGSNYKCVASYGHITCLGDLKDVDVENDFTPTYRPITEKRAHIARLKQFIKQSKEVFLATDDDREGEAIAWHICQQFDLSVGSTKRMIFHEITKPAILAAVRNTTKINMAKVNAARARQVLDLLVGFRISPILWANITRKSKQGLSAGRCQTPALALVYDNYKEIQQAPGKMVYNTTGYFTSKVIAFQLSTAIVSPEPMESFLEESVNHDHIFDKGKVRKTTKKPPKPFTTSALQQAANNEMRCSPKDTMAICQKLYEGGYITYMRTDSETYSKEFLETANTYIQEIWNKEHVHPELMSLSERAADGKSTKNVKTKAAKGGKGKKGNSDAADDDEEVKAQEAHEAIRPTLISRREIEEEISSKERRMYNLIWNNTAASCMAPAQYNGITFKVSAPQNMEYKASEEQVVFPGWKAVWGVKSTDVNETYTYLSKIKTGSELEYKKIQAKVTLKELKQHYTEAKLVQLLEEKGIGRPSTFSSLIEKIQDRGYVTRENVKGKMLACKDFELENDEITEHETKREFGNEKNKLVIQSLGIMVIEFLMQHFTDLFNYEYTKDMESKLDNIAKHELEWHNVCRECNNQIDTLSGPIQVKEKITIQLDAHHTYLIGKFGPVVKYEKNGVTQFKNVRKDLDIGKLKRKEYSLDDVLQDYQQHSLGKYKGKDLFMKKGKFGYFVLCGDTKHSLRGLEQELTRQNKAIEEATFDEIVDFIERPRDVLRKISDVANVRKSKFGYYIFHKTAQMKKPRFISLKNMTLEKIESCPLEDLEAMLS